MRERIKSIFDFVTDNFWFLLWVVVSVIFITCLYLDCYKVPKDDQKEFYKSIATQILENEDGSVAQFPDGIDVKIMVSGTPKFGYSGTITAEVHDGEIVFDFEDTSLSDITGVAFILSIIAALLVGLLSCIQRFIFKHMCAMLGKVKK